MTRKIAAQIALLAFTCALLAGLIRGNPATTVLTRALLAMLCGYVVGQVIAIAARMLVRDHLQRRKLEIDRGHVAAVAPAAGGAAVEGSSAEEAG